ncbi:hypothetical protein N8I74_12220 [Chitiniphilus purpureus]|uniref:DUF4124 domain-containing protein n=1 Tax=Chitiniphilus purpureus TaxID=2981137 RepID=A0ABY6DIA6_9NEIS|nr:hypothetical protein [Chitiniphilus sp. CD1]UXY14084.1 hypothetical protein N8I74_12220 [Chitiniphilus sp. CD1]
MRLLLLLLLSMAAFAGADEGVTKCRTSSGAISYQNGPCPAGSKPLKQITAKDAAGGTVSLQHYVQAERAAARRRPMPEARAAVSSFGEDQSKAVPYRYCAELLAEKEAIRAQQRIDSTQYLRDRHKWVVDRLHELGCPSA